MTPYFALTAIVWLAAMIYATPGAFATAFLKSERRGDPVRLAVWLVGFVFVFGSSRWIWSPDEITLWKAVFVISILTGVYVIRLMVAYGRGEDIAAHDETPKE